MTTRKTREVRRDEVLDAALEVFAELGLHHASTEDIARRAGISQPYVFRLFATKKELFSAVAPRPANMTVDAVPAVRHARPAPFRCPPPFCHTCARETS
jgi:hypothetical protein